MKTVDVYRDLVLVLYAKGSVFGAVVICVVLIAVSEWLKALLASSIQVEVASLGVRSPKVVK